MEKKRLIVLIFLLLILCIAAAATCEIRKVTTPVSFSQVGQGSLLLRDENDRIYSAVIMSCKGLKEFKSIYPVDFDLNEKDFEDSLYIVVFSDNHNEIVIDGFKQQRMTPYYYIDVADSGVEYMLYKPPEGKKYTAYAVIKVSNKLVISHAGVREKVQGGLCKRFPAPK